MHRDAERLLFLVLHATFFLVCIRLLLCLVLMLLVGAQWPCEQDSDSNSELVGTFCLRKRTASETGLSEIRAGMAGMNFWARRTKAGASVHWPQATTTTRCCRLSETARAA